MEPDKTTPPATPPAPTTPAAPAQPSQDPVAMAKRLGELEKVEQEFKDYQEKVGPIMETLMYDPELLKQTTAVHNKRLGRVPAAPAEDPKPTENKTTPPANPQMADTRNAVIIGIQSTFEDKVGISKMNPEQQKDARAKVGTMLKQMLDPQDNKTISQIFEEVSLQKLPWYLEKAYDLLNKENYEKSAYERGKNEVLAQYGDGSGMIGSVPGGSIPAEQTVLTPAQKKAAAGMKISEEEYLKNLKETQKA